MTVQNGRFEEDTADDILEAMMADAKEYFGESLNDDEEAIIRTFYRPIAERMAIVQGDIGLVLDSTQIDHAAGKALDYLTALIGVVRDPAEPATGTVTFKRENTANQDYVIPKGTIVQTQSEDPVRFETTEQVTLASGTSSLSGVDIEAVEPGARGNVGSTAIKVMPDPPVGIDSVEQPSDTDGGSDVETDEHLRERAKDELSSGARASAPALYSRVKDLDGVNAVSIFVQTSTNTTSLPGEGFEIVANGGNDNDIAQTIFDTMAAGDTSYGGNYGTSHSADAGVGNGQTYTISFSRPNTVTIYVDADLEVTDEFPGIDTVQDSIVKYTGGLLTTGQDTDGLEIGDDVIYGEVEYAVRDVTGVHDITNLEVDTDSTPTATSNISITDSEVATADATDSSLDISTTKV